jgi:hypothetical protein
MQHRVKWKAPRRWPLGGMRGRDDDDDDEDAGDDGRNMMMMMMMTGLTASSTRCSNQCRMISRNICAAMMPIMNTPTCHAHTSHTKKYLQRRHAHQSNVRHQHKTTTPPRLFISPAPPSSSSSSSSNAPRSDRGSRPSGTGCAPRPRRTLPVPQRQEGKARQSRSVRGPQIIIIIIIIPAYGRTIVRQAALNREPPYFAQGEH